MHISDQELQKIFKSAFRNQDIEIAKDLKHKEILNKAYGDSNWESKINFLNLRHWDGQTDQGAHANLSSEISLNGFLFGFIKFIYKITFKKNRNKETRNNLRDDISIIKKIGGLDILQNCKIEDTYGLTYSGKINGIHVNNRWLRYVYLAAQIRNKELIKDEGIWVDIGSFYGGLQGIIYKYSPNLRIILVDFQHQLLRSFIYLSNTQPSAKHFINPDINDRFENPGFYYIQPENIFKFKNLKIDLLTNFFSFGELTRESFEEYISSDLFKNSKKIFTVNRFISSPFFETTYYNDITIKDYLQTKSHLVRYFDEFPINHNMLIKRDLLGRSRYRTISSNYFELILERSI
jgi:putative sugar O-methyltransferase